MKCDNMGCIHLVQVRVQWQAPVNMVMNLRVPLKVGNFLTCWGIISYSRRPLFHEISYNQTSNNI